MEQPEWKVLSFEEYGELILERLQCMPDRYSPFHEVPVDENPPDECVLFCCAQCREDSPYDEPGQIMGALVLYEGMPFEVSVDDEDKWHGRVPWSWAWAAAKSGPRGLVYKFPENLDAFYEGENRARLRCRIGRHAPRFLTAAQLIGGAERALEGGFEYVHV